VYIKQISLSIALIYGSLYSPLQAEATNSSSDKTVAINKIKAQDLSLEHVFRAKPYTGKTASLSQFSFQSRYLAYAWNPYHEDGSDLYLYDTVTGTSKRITSPELMKSFDAPEVWDRYEKKSKQRDNELAERQAMAEAQAAFLRGEKIDLMKWEKQAIEELKREQAEKSAQKKAKELANRTDVKTQDNQTAQNKKEEKKESEKELWELRDDLKKKQEKNKLKVGDLYTGIENLVWSKQADELIFQYRGDLFRLFAETGKIERLSLTDKAERIISYNADGSGYLYMDDRKIYSAHFNSSVLKQLNPELLHADDAEKKYSITSTTISENKQWLAINAAVIDANTNTPARQVEIMHYSDRFASAKKVGREVSDDKRKIPATALYIRNANESSSRQPQPVFTNEGGDIWFEMSRVSFSEDGQRYTFSTWEREKELLKIYVGNSADNAKPTVVFEKKGGIGHEVVSVISPRFTPDGKKLIAVLDEQGFRQPYVIENGKATAIIKGNFEAHTIVGFSRDSQSLFLLANRDDFASMNLFKIDLNDGSMQAIGKSGEYHRNPVMAQDSISFTSTAGNWTQRPELKLFNIKNNQVESKTLTQSHDPQWAAVDLIRPERFSYRNRHGDSVEAYVFKPPRWSSSDSRPAVVYTYGGPLGDRHSVETDSFQPTAYMFGMYMAAKHGYVMVTVDPRGHSNYGRKFSDANWEQPGKPQTEDLEDLVKYMDKNLGVDRQRIGLTGWSFGGFQTQYTMYNSPDIFAAGIAGAGPTEWENYNSWYSGRTLGKTERNKASLKRFSLLPMTVGLKKPLLLVHGMLDPNVLYQDTVNVYRALLENGKESLVDLFLDPDGAHGLGGTVRAKTWHKKYEAFFLQHLGKAK
jgi:dienelactone hydrolase